MTITQMNTSKSTHQLERSNSSDILLGAYLVSHFKPHCDNCGTMNTPQWRKGWYSDLLQHSVLLCNACGLKYHKNQFCPYCKFVYGKESKVSSVWLICDTCARWVHGECEKRFGGHSHDVHYSCPDCRASQGALDSVSLPNEVTATEIREHALEQCPDSMDEKMKVNPKVQHGDDMDISLSSPIMGRSKMENSPFMIPSSISLL